MTHLGSAENRAKMHEKTDAEATDSMRMFRLGVQGGRPEPNRCGAAPEWFYKGTGHIVRFIEYMDVGGATHWTRERVWSRRDMLRQIESSDGIQRRGLILASEKFSVAITPHFAALIDPLDPGCPLRLQVVPQDSELVVSPDDMADPCGEDNDTVVEGLVHRYPDRVRAILNEENAGNVFRQWRKGLEAATGDLLDLGCGWGPLLAFIRERGPTHPRVPTSWTWPASGPRRCASARGRAT